MKTLYERLDKEVIAAMEKDSESWPILVSSYFDELKCNVAYFDLTFGVAKAVFDYKYGPCVPFNEYEFAQLFEQL